MNYWNFSSSHSCKEYVHGNFALCKKKNQNCRNKQTSSLLTVKQWFCGPETFKNRCCFAFRIFKSVGILVHVAHSTRKSSTGLCLSFVSYKCLEQLVYSYGSLTFHRSVCANSRVLTWFMYYHRFFLIFFFLIPLSLFLSLSHVIAPLHIARDLLFIFITIWHFFFLSLSLLIGRLVWKFF